MAPTQSHILYKPEEMKELGHRFEVGPSESKAASIGRQICIYISIMNSNQSILC